MKVDIYIDTDMKGTKSGRGHVWYQLATVYRGNPETRQYEVTFDDHNLHGASLEGLLDALKRIRGEPEVVVHTDSNYVAAQINTGNIYQWEGRGYMTTGGLPIRYTDLWRQVTGLIKEKCSSITVDTAISGHKRAEMAEARTRKPA